MPAKRLPDTDDERIVPFLMAEDADFAPDDYIFIPNVRKALDRKSVV